jgi:DNA-binding LacI/PurR family transcriptional regulator
MEKRKLTIGFSGIINYRSVIGQDIVFGIHSAAKDFNINLINFISTFRYSVKEDSDSMLYFRKKTEYINRQNIDGLITWASSFQFFMKNDAIQSFHKNLTPLPVVAVGMKVDAVPSIEIDNYSGIKVLLTHLINVHKYTKIAFIGSRNHSSYDERFNAYKKVLKENNIHYNSDLVYVTNDVDNNI